MRVISGKHKGRILKTLQSNDIRPTSDRAKEALFNIISAKIPQSDFLDIFAGSGAIGIEAISRGAKKVTLVDASRDSVAVIKKNLSAVNEKADVYLDDAKSFLSKSADKYDVIFFDPPYDYRSANALLETIYARNALKDDGIIIYEHKADYTDFSTEFFDIYDKRKYGIAVFEFLRRKQ